MQRIIGRFAIFKKGSSMNTSQTPSPVKVLALATIVAVCIMHGCASVSVPLDVDLDYDQMQVGARPGSPIVVPTNQVLMPAGEQIHLVGSRPTDLVLSPSGRFLAALANTDSIFIIDPRRATVKEKLRFSGPGRGGGSYTGICFSQDGGTLYASSVRGTVEVFELDADGRATGSKAIELPPPTETRRDTALPAGIAVSPDAKRLYVALNLANTVAEIDLTRDTVIRQSPVGTAPYGVLLLNDKLYVTNWGGRRPQRGDTTGPAGQGTLVKVDPVRHIANEGSVSVIDLVQKKVVKEIVVGMHSSGITATPDERYVIVANANSDTLSVIDTRSDTVIETISTRPIEDHPFGSAPNGLAISPDGKTLYVSNGTNNAVAVVAFDPPASRVLGFIPTGWYPAGLALDSRRNALYVANVKGTGSWRFFPEDKKARFNSHNHLGTISLIPLPNERTLDDYTQLVLDLNRQTVQISALSPPREGAKPKPVPERHGEPSVFKHVIYIIKENRTYDQVFGDMAEGEGDPELCTFGEEVTPNHHKLAREFVLLDNFCCSGVLSADGHQWTDSAYNTDYMEKSFCGWPRSYPDGMGEGEIDALAYAPSGFIWDNAIAHGTTLGVWGEFTMGRVRWKDSSNTSPITWTDIYRDHVNKTGLIEIDCKPSIQSLGPYIVEDTIGWDMRVPDQFRADKFIEDVRRFERTGNMPALSIICLPEDHTSGTNPAFPTPAAMVADNDLALGRMVEAVTHSKFWKDTCILVVEDDPQAGWDHVTAYRTVALVISPYTKRGVLDRTNYNQTSMVRTIELMLGLPPMNQLDSSATPMASCFTDQPDLTPYDAVPNRIPLDQMNKQVSEITDARELHYALESIQLPLETVDACDEDLFNHIIWYACKGYDTPYPAWAIDTVEQ